MGVRGGEKERKVRGRGGWGCGGGVRYFFFRERREKEIGFSLGGWEMVKGDRRGRGGGGILT